MIFLWFKKIISSIINNFFDFVYLFISIYYWIIKNFFDFFYFWFNNLLRLGFSYFLSLTSFYFDLKSFFLLYFVRFNTLINLLIFRPTFVITSSYFFAINLNLFLDRFSIYRLRVIIFLIFLNSFGYLVNNPYSARTLISYIAA